MAPTAALRARRRWWQTSITLTMHATVQGSMNACVVGLLIEYSKEKIAARKVETTVELALACVREARESGKPDRLSKPAPVKVQRLEPEDIALICQLYEDGKTVYEVAAEVGISRQRVSRALKRAGVQMRRRSHTAKQVIEMKQLYEQGLALVQVGERTGLDHGTVWHQLRAAGVPMRDTQGRSAQAETQAELSQ